MSSPSLELELCGHLGNVVVVMEGRSPDQGVRNCSCHVPRIGPLLWELSHHAVRKPSSSTERLCGEEQGPWLSRPQS